MTDDRRAPTPRELFGRIHEGMRTEQLDRTERHLYPVDWLGPLQFVSGTSSCRWNEEAVEDAEELAGHWLARVERQMTSSELARRILRGAALARIRGTKATKAFARLEQDLLHRRERTLIVAALVGVEWLGDPVLLAPNVLIGRASDQFERDLDLITQGLLDVGFSFPALGDEPWWLEDLACQRSDPDAGWTAEDGSFPVLLAAVLPGTYGVACSGFHRLVESLAGAVGLAARHTQEPNPGENWADLAFLEHHDQLKRGSLQRGADDPSTYGTLWVHPEALELPIDDDRHDIPLETVLDTEAGALIRVASASAPETGNASDAVTRVGAACAAHHRYGGLLGAAVALEALLPAKRWGREPHQAFVDGVPRLIGQPDMSALGRRDLRRLYDERSNLVHEGAEEAAVEQIGDLWQVAQEHAATGLINVAAAIEAGTLTDDESIVRYLDGGRD